MNKRTIIAVCVLVIAAGVLMRAQGGAVRYRAPQPRMVRLTEPWLPEGRRSQTRVIGTVIDIRQAPVAHARVQLRDLSSGRVSQEGVAGELGEYEFAVAEPGIYVVEMVGGINGVVALSNAGALARYQTMNTVIQLPGRWDMFRSQLIEPQRMTQFVGMSAQTTMTATTLQAATTANVTPADPGEPVSP